MKLNHRLENREGSLYVVPQDGSKTDKSKPTLSSISLPLRDLDAAFTCLENYGLSTPEVSDLHQIVFPFHRMGRIKKKVQSRKDNPDPSKGEVIQLGSQFFYLEWDPMFH